MQEIHKTDRGIEINREMPQELRALANEMLSNNAIEDTIDDSLFEEPWVQYLPDFSTGDLCWEPGSYHLLSAAEAIEDYFADKEITRLDEVRIEMGVRHLEKVNKNLEASA